MGRFRLDKIEPFLFLGVLVFSLTPVFACKFFVTMDSAAHLSNATLIKELVFNNNETIHHFFELNTLLVPNWTGHFLLVVFKSFLPAYRAEKVLLVLYIVGMAYAYRYLIKVIAPKNLFFSYMVFPFIFSIFIFLGFYNYCLSIISMILSMALWIKSWREGFTSKRLLLLGTVFLLTYFSHLFSFLWLLVFIGLHACISFLGTILSEYKQTGIGKILKSYLVKAAWLLLVSFIPLLLTMLYFSAMPVSDYNLYLPARELIHWITTLQPLIAYNGNDESIYTQSLLYAIIILFLIAIYLRFKRNYREKTGYDSTHKFLFASHDSWLVAAIVLILLYFLVPDINGSSGFVSTRLLYLFFFFIVVWIGIQPFSKWFAWSAVVVSLCCHVFLIGYHTRALKNLNRVATECNNAAQHIKPNSVVLPLNWHRHWLFGHISNYMGIDKPMIILDNYEADNDYFPVIWSARGIPVNKVGNAVPDLTGCKYIDDRNYNTRDTVQIDYIFIIGDIPNDYCARPVKKELDENFNLVYSSENTRLYKSNL